MAGHGAVRANPATTFLHPAAPASCVSEFMSNRVLRSTAVAISERLSLSQRSQGR